MITRETLKEHFSRANIGKWLRLCRGLAIVVATLLLTSYITSYVFDEKIEMVYMLRGFEKLVPPPPDFESIVTARFIQLGITLAIILMLIVLVVMFKGQDLNIVKLLIMVTHSFIIVFIIIALQLPFIWQIPKVSYMIVDANFANITFRGVTIVGVSHQAVIEITSPIVKASYARVYRAYSNLTLPEWSKTGADRIKTVIRDTETFMNLTDVKWVSDGLEMTLEEIVFCTGNWSAVEYQDVLGRLPVREQEVGFHEMMLSVLSMLSNAGLAIYNSVGFKRLYNASVKLTVIVAALLFLLLSFFGGL